MEVGSTAVARRDYTEDWRSRGSERQRSPQDAPALAEALQIQRSYWTFNPAEKAKLLARPSESLSWAEMLRLHHLTCLEILSTGEGSAQLVIGDRTIDDSDEAPHGAARTFCEELAQRLMSIDSPYRARYAFVWQGEAGQSEQREAELEGLLRNASVTHLACLEVIQMNRQSEPVGISFIPFDDIRGVIFGSPCLFRLTKLLYEDGRDDEVVYVPLVYGVSWRTDKEYDHDGTMTRFCCHLTVDEDPCVGMGIGHQDFVLGAPKANGNRALFGLGSVGELAFALDPEDPRFDEKCRGRGLDPSRLRWQMAGGL